MIDPIPIIREILKEYALPASGIHGIVHWARVLENGLKLADETGADREVVSLFALFHDSRRINERTDPDHGRRGAIYAESWRGRLFDLNDADFELLRQACDLHTDGLLEGDMTLQTCWDADRLDLGRVGITPLPRKLCTPAARRLIAWADARAQMDFEPELLAPLGYLRDS